MKKYLPMYKSSVSNEIHGFLEVEETTFLSSIVTVVGVQRYPVTLLNGSTQTVGSITKRKRPDDITVWVLVAQDADDLDIAYGSVGFQSSSRDLAIGGQTWVETGFMGQIKQEVYFERQLNDAYLIAST